MDHETLRHLADTWGLVFLCLTFVIAVLILFRPGAGKHYRQCAEMPLKDEMPLGDEMTLKSDGQPDVRELGK